MPGLREVETDDLRCAECRINEPVGPCAACESMICGDCGVITTDPAGRKVICTSCARMVAHVSARPARRRSPTTTVVAVGVLVAVAVALVSLLLR